MFGEVKSIWYQAYRAASQINKETFMIDQKCKANKTMIRESLLMQFYRKSIFWQFKELATSNFAQLGTPVVGNGLHLYWEAQRLAEFFQHAKAHSSVVWSKMS